MTDKEILIRMYTLQLQQLTMLVCLSEKLNLMMQKTGMPQSDIDEIKKIEEQMRIAGEAKALHGWEKEFDYLAKSST